MNTADLVGSEDASKLPILVAFCCYSPDSELESNVRVASRVCEKVYVIDDGSLIEDPKFFDFAHQLSNVVVVIKTRNVGIADSFNVGLNRAAELALPYYLTFDQDTLVDEGQLRMLYDSMRLLSDRGIRVGVIGPGRISNESYLGTSSERYRSVPEVIQSAGLFRTKALLSIGGAQEDFVIDAVDTDICLRLSQNGWSVYVDNDVYLEHTIGSGRHIRLFGRDVAVTNHSPARRYYITRNRLYVLRAHGWNNKMWAAVTLRRLMVSSVFAVTLESQRYQKLQAVVSGVYDFLRRRKGKLRGEFRPL